jgi:ABC-type nitrate/sulfonate/bicarbonate transport system substrate-binding protein
MRLPLVSALRISAMVFAGLVAAAPVAKAADKLSIILDWNIGPDHAPLLIGQYAGYFKEKGLDVTLIAFGSRRCAAPHRCKAGGPRPYLSAGALPSR